MSSSKSARSSRYHGLQRSQRLSRPYSPMPRPQQFTSQNMFTSPKNSEEANTLISSTKYSVSIPAAKLQIQPLTITTTRMVRGENGLFGSASSPNTKSSAMAETIPTCLIMI